MQNKMLQSIANKWASTLLLVAMLATILGFGWLLDFISANDQNLTATPVRAMPVSTIRAEPSDYYLVKRSYLGQIESQRQSSLSFELDGKLIKLYVDEGESVSQGQLLAELDIQLLLAKKKSLLAEVAAARAKLDELLVGPRVEVVRAAEADVDNWEARQKLARLTAARSQRLVDMDAVSHQENENDLFNEQAVAARLSASRARLEELSNGTRSEQIAAQQAVWQRLKADHEFVEIQIRKSKLLAPFDGVVFRRQLDEGTVVRTGQIILDVFDHKNMEARIGLPRQAVDQAKQNGNIQLTYDNRKIVATLKSVRPAKNRNTRTIDVVYSLNQFSSPPILGDVIELELNRKIEERGFWLPSDALVENYRGLWGCFIASESDTNQKAELVELELLHQQSGRVFVSGAIRTGDQVIVSGAHRIVANQVVDARPLHSHSDLHSVAVNSSVISSMGGDQ